MKSLVKQYNFLDVSKFLMAFCVVGLHSHSIAHDDYAPFFHYLLLSAVPFFYITSGFLVGRKFGEDRKFNTEICKNSIFRYLRIYLLWILIYTPITIFVSYMDAEPFYLDLWQYFRGVIFVGEIEYSYPLWYLLGLVVALTMVALFLKIRLKLELILVISLVFLLIGELYKSVLPVEGTVYYNIYNIYTGLFCSTRNGFFVGFPLVMIGMIFGKYMSSQTKMGILLGLCLLIFGWLMFVKAIPMWMYITGGGIFCCSANIILKDSPIFKKLRTQSVWIFLIHMYFIFVFAMIDIILPKYSICKSVYLTWFVVGILSLLTSIMMEYLRNKKGWGFLSKLVS